MIPDDDDNGHKNGHEDAHDNAHDDAHDGGGQNDVAAGDGAGFADLVGETRPLKDGAPRVPPVTPDPVRKQASLRGRDAAPSRFRWPDPEQPLLAAGRGVSDQQLQELARGEPAPEEKSICTASVQTRRSDCSRSDSSPRVRVDCAASC